MDRAGGFVFSPSGSHRKPARGIIRTMKLRITQLRSHMVLISIALMAISIACSASKSAESPSANAANASANEPLTSPSSSITQDKQPCTLTLSAAPSINGLRLRMTSEEVLALFPGSKEDPEVSSALARRPSALGTSGFLIKPAKYENKDKFTGISQITFNLLDGRVSTLTIGYNGPEYSHVDKFVSKFVEGTNFPAADQWDAHEGLNTQMKTLTCTDFEVRAFAGGRGSINSISMRDREAEKKLDERAEKAAREQASPTPGNQ